MRGHPPPQHRGPRLSLGAAAPPNPSDGSAPPLRLRCAAPGAPSDGGKAARPPLPNRAEPQPLTLCPVPPLPPSPRCQVLTWSMSAGRSSSGIKLAKVEIEGRALSSTAAAMAGRAGAGQGAGAGLGERGARSPAPLRSPRQQRCSAPPRAPKLLTAWLRRDWSGLH